MVLPAVPDLEPLRKLFVIVDKLKQRLLNQVRKDAALAVNVRALVESRAVRSGRSGHYWGFACRHPIPPTRWALFDRAEHLQRAGEVFRNRTQYRGDEFSHPALWLVENSHDVTQIAVAG